MVATAVHCRCYHLIGHILFPISLQGHSPLADVFKCNPSNIYAASCTISTNSVLTWFL